MRKNLIAFFLAVCMVMCMNPITLASAASTTGADYTNGQLAERLDTILNQGISSGVSPSLPAVNGTFPRHQMYTVKFPSRSWKGYQCMAYAYAVYNYLFDSDPYGADAVCFSSLTGKNTLSYQDFVAQGIKLGSYLRTTCYSNGAFHASNGHSIIILSYDSAQITYIEGNTSSANTWRVNLKTYTWDNFNKYLLSGNGRYVQTLRQPSNNVYNSLAGDSGSTSTSGHWEYRYVGYATSGGRHECWCGTYLKNRFGSANLRYSDWGRTQYSANGSSWTCGSNCKGDHTGIAKIGSNGVPYWSEYTLPDGKNYYWEEKRWVEDTQVVPPPACTQHVKGNMLYCESVHPHRNYYVCSVCGKEFTDETANYVDSCKICNPGPTGHWEQRGWTTTPVSASDTIRNIETKKVEISPSRTEYRYVGYATTDGKHECWCETYLRSKFGSAVLRYSDWSTTRYSANGSAWSCGQCNGNHTGVDHYGSDGRAWWAEFTLPDGRNFYWEEQRTIPAEYRTEYRYEEWIPG